MSKMGDILVEAAQEMVDHASGKINLRTSEYSILPIVKSISVDEIKETRKKLGVSQSVFAVMLGVSKKTVESWETGRYAPYGSARRLITMLREDPALPQKHGFMVSRTG